ncbi:MAG: MFS transporter [Planctomycetota bacterium]|jgi:MFS family permease
MEWKLYFALSFAMFMEYAIWGAWMPVLAARLLGPLKMTGKQTGWIYATLPLACIVSPLISGPLADKYLDAKWILGAAHVIGAVLLYLAARKTTFKGLFAIMLFYSLCFAGTLPLVNAILLVNVSDLGARGRVFMWAPIAWALVGYFLTGWRWIFKTGQQGRDCLYLGAILSIVMGIGCIVFLPTMQSTEPAEMSNLQGTSPEADQTPILQAMTEVMDFDFLIFVLVSMVFFGLMQFYFLGTAPFMQDMGIPSKNVPASMAIAQAVQAIATFFLMAFLLERIGTKETLIVGAMFWGLLYIVYINEKPRWLIVASQSFHGLAYVLFVIVGQNFTDAVASRSSSEIRSSMQALLFAATTGVGLFLGTQFAGFIMDRFRKDDKFQWRSIFMVPCAIAFVSVLVFVIFFKG